MFQFVLAMGMSFFVMRLSTYVFPESICMLLSLLLLVALLILLVSASIQGITKWRKTSKLWPAPALLCLAFIIGGFELTPSMGAHISDWRFKRNLDQFSKVVGELRNKVASCTGPCDGEMALIKGVSVPVHVQAVWGGHCDDGGVIVLFLLDTDVLLLHEGYFFKDYGEGSDCALQSVSPELGWPHAPYVRHITGHWYHFSDQPGL
jgi:hypothetical protein